MYDNDRPSSAEVLAGPLGVELPKFGETLLESVEFTDVMPTEYRADAVVTRTLAGERRFALVIEAQTGPGPTKALHLAGLRDHTACPIGVHGPAAGALAVMSTLAHGERPHRREIFGAFLAALTKTDDDHRRLYYDLEPLGQQPGRGKS